ncbi:MAG: cysteine dioxygenase family protein [Acidobacteriota bacterium]
MTENSAGGVALCSSSTESLPASLAKLVETIEAEQSLTPSKTKKLLQESDVTAEDLAPWAEFDHSAADSYGRRMVWDGGSFELMVMSWVDGDMAAIHDHGYTQWGAVKLFGPAEHAIFRVADGKLVTTERRVFKDGDVLSVSHDMIHQMGNIGQAPYLTLHLYGCYERDCDVTGDARLYELDEGKIQRTSGGVFFGLPESQVDRRESSPVADFPTALRHKVELLKRLVHSTGAEAAGSLQDDRQRRLAAELVNADTYRLASSEIEAMEQARPAIRRRYLDILGQELTAAARIQRRLHLAGLFPHALSERLGDVLAIQDPAERLDAHCQAVDEVLGVLMRPQAVVAA